jgi:GWxTD domain-containing protein
MIKGDQFMMIAMLKRFFKITVLVLLISASGLPASAQKAPPLTERYRTWIEEEVVYIITPTERQVFLDLTTDRERNLFIEAFWRHRDPTPGTEKNEFKEEHERRIQYANKHFLGAGKPGWKTDRGKVYIILGEPRTQQSFLGLSSIYPAEIWSYQGIGVPGLPEEFDLLFFQKNGMGDFILYNPAADGPWSLLPTYRGNINDYVGAAEMLSVIEPQLARTAISLIPNETVHSFPSLQSTVLLQNLDGAATRKVEDLWARKFRDYRSLVDVEYSANYIDSGSLLQVIQDPSGIPFVHFSMQPRVLSVAEEGNGVATELDFNGILTDLQGRTIFQFDKTIPLRFSREQYEKLRTRPFAFADLFPIIPGEYKLSVLMKNGASKEFTTLEGTVKFPAAFPAPRLSPLLLGFNAVRQSAASDGPRPFVVRGFQIFGDPESTFVAKDTLHVFVQVLGLGTQLKGSGSLRFSLEADGRQVESKTQVLAGNPDALNFLEVFPLAKYAPGYYRADVALVDATDRILDRQGRDFQIVAVDAVPRPWINSQSLVAQDGQPAVDHILGRESLNAGDPAAALPRLEKARAADPSKAVYAFDLGRALFALNRMSEAWAVLQPFAEASKSDLETCLLLGRTEMALGRLDEAVALFRSALETFGLTTAVLNEMGEAQAGLGLKAEAIATWKKSLEADPNQPAIKEKIAALEKKAPGSR